MTVAVHSIYSDRECQCKLTSITYVTQPAITMWSKTMQLQRRSTQPQPQNTTGQRSAHGNSTVSEPVTFALGRSVASSTFYCPCSHENTSDIIKPSTSDLGGCAGQTNSHTLTHFRGCTNLKQNPNQTLFGSWPSWGWKTTSLVWPLLWIASSRPVQGRAQAM